MTTLDKNVKVVVEMRGVSKENIQIKSYDMSVEKALPGLEKIHEVINLPEEADVETRANQYSIREYLK